MSTKCRVQYDRKEAGPSGRMLRLAGWGVGDF